MTVSFRPYRAGDINRIAFPSAPLPASVDGLACQCQSFTATVDYRVIGCGGLIRMEPWRAHTWALFSRDLPLRTMVEIRRFCREVLNRAEAEGVHCIEAEVGLDSKGGHYFALGLGFQLSGFCRGRMANGSGFVRYERSTARPAPSFIGKAMTIAEQRLLGWLESTSTSERIAA